MASDGRSYVRGHFCFTLDGFNCGLIQKVEGGDVVGEVTQLPEAHNYYVRKHIANVKYSPMKVQLGVSMAQPIQDWIAASLEMNYMRKSGAVDALDFKLESRHTIEFKDALLTEITFPACDGAAKDAAFVTLGFAPETVRRKKGDGGKRSNPSDMGQKMWTPGNFKFTVDGLEKACAKVSKVNALTVKQTTVSDAVGMERDYLLEPAHIEFPDVEVTVSEEFVDDFINWHQTFVIDAVNTETDHKTGSLEFLNQNRQKTLLTLGLNGLGITKVASAPMTNNEDKIASYTVSMYCENLTAKFG